MHTNDELTNAANAMFEFLRDAVYNPDKASLDLNKLPVCCEKLGKGLMYYCECVNQVRKLASELANGNLNVSLPSSDNEIAAPLKSLHASLKHLSWQAREVARGDYNQNVDFMGEFSESFNLMIMQLRQNHEAMVSELSQVKGFNRELTAIAYTDHLTKLFNRTYGMNTLKTFVEQREHFVLIFVDLDNLKYVNDKFGHNEGDRYLIYVANRLYNFPGDSMVSRLGGDEIMILARNITEKEAAAAMEQIRKNIINMSETPGILYYMNLSYGIIEVFGNNRHTTSELLSIADTKMYDFKRSNKMFRASENNAKLSQS